MAKRNEREPNACGVYFHEVIIVVDSFCEKAVRSYAGQSVGMEF